MAGSDDDLAGLFDEVPEGVADQEKAGPSGDLADAGDAKLLGLFRCQTRPQPESAVAENREEEKDVVEVLQGHPAGGKMVRNDRT